MRQPIFVVGHVNPDTDSISAAIGYAWLLRERDNLDAIAHLHVAGAPGRGFPGAGQEIDYARIIRSVHAAGYTGFVGQEFLPVGDPIDELAAAVALFESYAAG